MCPPDWPWGAQMNYSIWVCLWGCCQMRLALDSVDLVCRQPSSSWVGLFLHPESEEDKRLRKEEFGIGALPPPSLIELGSFISSFLALRLRFIPGASPLLKTSDCISHWLADGRWWDFQPLWPHTPIPHTKSMNLSLYIYLSFPLPPISVSISIDLLLVLFLWGALTTVITNRKRWSSSNRRYAGLSSGLSLSVSLNLCASHIPLRHRDDNDNTYLLRLLWTLLLLLLLLSIMYPSGQSNSQHIVIIECTVVHSSNIAKSHNNKNHDTQFIFLWRIIIREKESLNKTP